MTKTPPARPSGDKAPLPALFSIAQVAEATGLSERTVRRRIADGTIPAHRIGSRVFRIERAAVLALIGR